MRLAMPVYHRLRDNNILKLNSTTIDSFLGIKAFAHQVSKTPVVIEVWFRDINTDKIIG